jgi:hypothetical protein
MGAPTSALFSEIHLQKIEHTKILRILKKHNIYNYFRYVDDILLIYDISTTNITEVLNQFNGITTSLQFTIEHGQNKQINFLDITTHRQQYEFEFDIYRKPTTTDHIIPNDSCHPRKHKQSAIRFLINRMEEYPLNNHKQEKELHTIQQILQANHYNNNNIRIHKTNQSTQRHNPEEHKKKKRAIFTYVGPQTRTITKILHKAGLNTAFTTKHTIHNRLQRRHNTIEFDSCGVYQLECPDCNKQYVGQTGRSFLTRYKEHITDYRNNSKKSLYAKHLLEQGHSMQPIHSCMKVLEYQQKSKKLNALEQFHIYKVTKSGKQINEQFTENQNPIFESLFKICSNTDVT